MAEETTFDVDVVEYGQNVISKTVNERGRIVECTMTWEDDGPDSRISPSTTAQKKKLNDLLREANISGKLAALFPSSAGGTAKAQTIIDAYDHNINYRIDNQIDVNYNTNAPRMVLHYQIAKGTHAVVVISWKPTKAPENLVCRFMDDAKYGFTASQIDGFIQRSLRYSVDKRRNTGVHFELIATPRAAVDEAVDDDAEGMEGSDEQSPEFEEPIDC